jgi:probable phosphoglycerate mutase
VRNVKGDALIFSSGHFIRVFAARWIGLEPSVHSSSFLLSTASLSAVGYDRNMSHPVIRLWNDTHHVRTQLPSGDANEHNPDGSVAKFGGRGLIG